MRRRIEGDDAAAYIFEGMVRHYFKDVQSYYEDRKDRVVEFHVYNEEVTFDNLFELSKILDTKLINFHGETIQTGYCETCASTETYVLVKCSGVRFEEWHDVPVDPQIVQGEDVDYDGNDRDY